MPQLSYASPPSGFFSAEMMVSAPLVPTREAVVVAWYSHFCMTAKRKPGIGWETV
jgi:hypothetical protein